LLGSLPSSGVAWSYYPPTCSATFIPTRSYPNRNLRSGCLRRLRPSPREAGVTRNNKRFRLLAWRLSESTCFAATCSGKRSRLVWSTVRTSFDRPCGFAAISKAAMDARRTRKDSRISRTWVFKTRPRCHPTPRRYRSTTGGPPRICRQTVQSIHP